MSSGVYLIRVDPSRNIRRFYKMLLAPSLFGEWVLVREWGRIGAAGTTKADHFPSPGEALLAMQELVRRKKRRGYFSLRGSASDE